MAPTPGGIYFRQLAPLLRTVARRNRIVGMDIVEIAPSYDFANGLTCIARRPTHIKCVVRLLERGRSLQARPELAACRRAASGRQDFGIETGLAERSDDFLARGAALRASKVSSSVADRAGSDTDRRRWSTCSTFAPRSATIWLMRAR